MKTMKIIVGQNGNVSKTNGDSNICERHTAATSQMDDINSELVSFLTLHNLSVRESTGFMQRTERC